MFRKLCAIALLGVLAFPALASAESFAHIFIPAVPPHPAPAIVFQDTSGHSLSLKDFSGSYVLLNLWATWCGPCVREMPSLSALQARFDPRRFVVIALNEDHDGLSAAPNFYSRYGIKSLFVYAENAGRAPMLFHAPGLPTSYLIDPHGMVIGRVEGATDWNAPDAVSFLETKIYAPAFP